MSERAKLSLMSRNIGRLHPHALARSESLSTKYYKMWRFPVPPTNEGVMLVRRATDSGLKKRRQQACLCIVKEERRIKLNWRGSAGDDRAYSHTIHTSDLQPSPIGEVQAR